MKKDILIPTSKGLKLAVIPLNDSEWDMLLVNENEHSLSNILVVTEGQNETQQSSKLRYYLESIPPLSSIKIESILGEVMHLENIISVSYYIGLEIYEKEFKFTLSQLTHISQIDILGKDGYCIA